MELSDNAVYDERRTLLGGSVSSTAKNVRPGASEPLDAIDERLLAALVADARISN